MTAAFVDGFMGMGGSLNMSATADVDENGEASADSDVSGSDFKVVMACLFNDNDAAEKYFDKIYTDPSFTGIEGADIETKDTDDGKVVTVKNDTAEVIFTLTGDGIIYFEETIKG